MPSLRLLDGKYLSADTWEELENEYASAFMNATIPKTEFREAIASRAKTWSGTDLAVYGSAQDFLLECERAGLILSVSSAYVFGNPNRPLEASIPRLVFLKKLADDKAKRDALIATRQNERNARKAQLCR